MLTVIGSSFSGSLGIKFRLGLGLGLGLGIQFRLGLMTSIQCKFLFSGYIVKPIYDLYHLTYT
jgi:hypothetical protein